MLEFLNSFRGVDFQGVALRIVLSVVCGGLIGLEREQKRRPAGFRTHILICLGAALAAATNQYLYLDMRCYTDVARMGAQVIAGVSFIGSGVIIVTKRRRVKGLTTAAGLWVAAIVGLCCGSGLYEGAIYSTFLVLMAELFFSRLEYSLMRRVRDLNVYVEYAPASCLEWIMERFHNMAVKVLDVEITHRAEAGAGDSSCAIFVLQTGKGFTHQEVMNEIARSEGVLVVEEI